MTATSQMRGAKLACGLQTHSAHGGAWWWAFLAMVLSGCKDQQDRLAGNNSITGDHSK